MKAGFDVGWLLCIIIRGMLIMMAAVVMEATEAIEAVGWTAQAEVDGDTGRVIVLFAIEERRTQPQQLWSCSSRIVLVLKLEVVRVCHEVVNDISEYKRLCSRLRGWPMPTQPPTTLRGCMPPSSFLIEANTEPRWGYWGCCLPRSESLRAGASLPCPPFCSLCVMMTIVVVVLMMMIMRPTKVCHSIKTLKSRANWLYMMHHNISFFLFVRLFQLFQIA